MQASDSVTGNLFSFYMKVAEKSGMITGNAGHLDFTGIHGGQWPSFILGSEKLDDQAISSVAGRILNGELPSFWIQEMEDSELTIPLFEKYGLRQVNRWKGMILQLAENVPAPHTESSIEIRKVTAQQEMYDWLEIVNSEVMTSKKLQKDAFMELLKDPSLMFFGLWRSGVLVSTALVYSDNKTAGLYFIATRKDQRGSGYGTAIISSAVNYCFSKGLSTFVLHATRTGESIYRRLGFQEVNQYGIFWMMSEVRE